MCDETSTAPRRRYTKRRRAELEEETRRRITEATVDLHGTLGPARTTVSAIAERAGVQRATVYRHFPDDRSLLEACSAHWGAQNPRPDIGRWAAMENPEERLRAALDELYSWYDRTEYMMEKVTRDAAVVEAMRAPAARAAEWLQAAVDVLAAGRPGDDGGARAAIGHAVAFDTWRSLVRRQGLSSAEAVELMAQLAGCAGGEVRPSPAPARRSSRAARRGR